MRFPICRALVASSFFSLCLVGFASVAAAADNYDFLAAPQIDLNRIFRLDKATGEVGACQFGLKEGSPVGITLCYPPGQGAGPQGPSDYALVSSRHQQEGGVWRVDLRSGQMSICYVLNEAVVCTPPAK
jgi:hypothetical protein